MQTAKQAARAKQQIEDLARRASAMKRAVEALEDEFCGLADWPEDIGNAMPRLSAAAELLANAAKDWARLCNVDFDPSTPLSQQE